MSRGNCGLHCGAYTYIYFQDKYLCGYRDWSIFGSYIRIRIIGQGYTAHIFQKALI